MKKILIVVICLVTFSCNESNEKSKEIENLLTKITVLEKQNKKLKDSIIETEERFLYSQILIGIPDSITLKVGKKNNIPMLFQTYNWKLPKYEIFRIIDSKEVKIGENNQTKFEYEFIPKSVKDNEPEFLVKIPYNGKIIKIPGKIILDVEE